MERKRGTLVPGAGRGEAYNAGGVTSPLSVLRGGDVLSGPWFGVWILHGNYSSSLLFDTVPLTDPLMTLQSLASGHPPATVALTGAVMIDRADALAGSAAVPAAWVCPLNPITDLAKLVTQAL